MSSGADIKFRCEEALAVIKQNSPQKIDRFEEPVRFRKRMTYCRVCKREVEKTETYGFQAGRRVLSIMCYCHGEKAQITVCEDQLQRSTKFELFGGELEAAQEQVQLSDTSFKTK